MDNNNQSTPDDEVTPGEDATPGGDEIPGDEETQEPAAQGRPQRYKGKHRAQGPINQGAKEGYKTYKQARQEGKKMGQAAKKGFQAGKKAYQGAKKGVQKAGKAAGKKLAKEGAKQAGKAAVRAGAQAAGSAAPVVGNIAAEAATQIAEKGLNFAARKAAQLAQARWDKLASTPADIVNSTGKFSMKLAKIVGGTWVFLLFMLVVFMSMVMSSSNNNEGFEEQFELVSNESLLSITQTGPAHANNPPPPGTILSYTITVSYPNPFDDIILSDRVPPGTQYVPNSATQKVTCGSGQTCTASHRTINWSAKDNDLTTNPLNTSFTLKFKVVSISPNTPLPNVITAQVIPASESATTE